MMILILFIVQYKLIYIKNMNELLENTWVATEGTGREIFEFKAGDLTQALIVCEMYNATLIGKKE